MLWLHAQNRCTSGSPWHTAPATLKDSDSPALQGEVQTGILTHSHEEEEGQKQCAGTVTLERLVSCFIAEAADP